VAGRRCPAPGDARIAPDGLWCSSPGGSQAACAWRQDDRPGARHGIAAHDLYHAGQVQFIKRLCGAKPRHDSRRSHAAGSAAGADTDARARRRSTWQTSKHRRAGNRRKPRRGTRHRARTGIRRATVYVTGRSVEGGPTTDSVPGTIDQTARDVSARGGLGIAVRCDHTVDADVEALFVASAATMDASTCW